jgi:hypothetical protein
MLHLLAGAPLKVRPLSGPTHLLVRSPVSYFRVCMVVWSFLFKNVQIQKDSSNLKKFNFKNGSNLKIVQIQKMFGFVICSNPKKINL